MWQLEIKLEEMEENYMLYQFRTLNLLMDFISTNEVCNTDHCIYTIEKVN